MQLLLVDDEIIELEALKAGINWEKAGIDKLSLCTNICDAMNILDQNDISVMITDIEMPGGSGLELLSWTHKHHPDVLSILFTCHANFTFAQEAFHSHAFDYILKPINPPEIEATVSKAVQIIRKRLGYVIKEDEQPDKRNVIQQIHDYILDHPDENPGREQLANLVFFNPDYLSRYFKKETGISLTDYIAKVKIQQAKELLADSSLPISQIALSLGYGNFSYFSKKFRKEVGISPIEYRNNCLYKKPII